MREIPATHRRRRIHGFRFREFTPGMFLGIEQRPQLVLLGMFRTGGITGGGTDALVVFADEFFVIEILAVQSLPGRPVTPLKAPVDVPYAIMHVLGIGLGQAVGEGLDHDGVVIVVLLFKLFGFFFSTEDGNDEGANSIFFTACFGCDKISNTTIGLPGGRSVC